MAETVTVVEWSGFFFRIDRKIVAKFNVLILCFQYKVRQEIIGVQEENKVFFVGKGKGLRENSSSMSV